MSSIASSLPAADAERALDGLRTRAGVRLMTADKDGFSLIDQENGTYGYTCSPIAAEAPLFQANVYQSFECHKLADGSLHLVGWVTDAERCSMESGREAMDVSLFPDARAEASALVSLPLERIGQTKPPARAEGNFLRLRVNPVQ